MGAGGRKKTEHAAGEALSIIQVFVALSEAKRLVL